VNIIKNLELSADLTHLAFTWSSIAELPEFQDGNLPLPILISDERAPNTKLVSGNSTIVEITPFEFGSWDPNIFGFAPTKYTGSRFESGTLADTEPCVVGFDNAGFVMATSSTLFNIAIDAIMSRKTESTLLEPLNAALRALATKYGNKEDDIASWNPNPFRKWNEGQNVNANSNDLTLVDGGEDGQNIPLYPHIQQQRSVDVVFAVDASGDTIPGSWPDGTAMVASYARNLNSAVMNGTAFPAVPDPHTFINLGLNVRPTFFGCESKNNSVPTPIVVYLPNAPYSYMSNLSTKTTEFSNSVRNSIIQNGYEIATMGNGTFEQEWPMCVGCVILRRSFERTKTAIPQQCKECFKKHCWNGTIDSTPHSYDPPLGVARNPGKDGIIAPVDVTKKKSGANSAILSYHSIWTIAGVVLGVSFLF
jgi:lysophospholipase